MNAFEQLLAEGYVEGRQGAGTFVVQTMPAPDGEPIAPDTSAAAATEASPRTLSRRDAVLAATPMMPLPRVAPDQQGIIAFRNRPALDAFPRDLWARLLARNSRRASDALLNYKLPLGHQPLREAIATYLGAARGVNCDATQVLIVAGSQQALDLSARLLLDPGDAAWIEDPGYLGARGALVAAGARLIPVPVDREGLDVAAGIARSPDARLAFVTPSHQSSLGVTLSLPRRLALLEWAARAGAWIIEDDYDSEYRYRGRPLAALQGLDRYHRVLYVGTFSKVLFPSLRIGYMVVPADLVDAFATARLYMDQHSPSIEQAALADFIAEGHFAHHIRRMRALYAERQADVVAAAQRELRGLLDVAPADAGMHLVGWLPEGIDDRVASHAAAAFGVEILPLSLSSIEVVRRGALILAYTSLNAVQIADGIERLARALRTVHPAR